MLTKIKNRPLDLIIETLGVVAIIVSFALPAFYYSDLPDTLYQGIIIQMVYRMLTVEKV
jgi:hypothetical protein